MSPTKKKAKPKKAVEPEPVAPEIEELKAQLKRWNIFVMWLEGRELTEPAMDEVKKMLEEKKCS